MNWDLTYSPELAIIRVQVRNEFVVSDLRKLLDEVLSEPHWFPGCRILYNYDDLDVSLMSTREIGQVRSVYDEYRDRCETCRTALYASSRLRYGLARQFQSLAGLTDGEKLQVFTSEQEAIAWLVLHPFENIIANQQSTL